MISNINSKMILLSTFSVISVLVVALSFLLPVACLPVSTESLALVWVWITNTGSVVGIGSILVLATVFWFLLHRGQVKRFYKSVLLFVFLVFCLGGTALINEYVIKQNIKLYRPSIQNLEKTSSLNADEYYALN